MSDELEKELERLRTANNNMAAFFVQIIQGLEDLARTLSMNSGGLFGLVTQMKNVQNSNVNLQPNRQQQQQQDG